MTTSDLSLPSPYSGRPALDDLAPIGGLGRDKAILLGAAPEGWGEGLTCRAAYRYSDPISALSALRRAPYEVIVVILPLEGWAAEDLVEEALRVNPTIGVIIVGMGIDDAAMVRLIRIGAFDVWRRSEAAETAGFWERRLTSAFSQLRARATSERVEELSDPWRQGLVGRSPAMRHVCDIIRLVGNRRTTVLITGETGTGKEMVARAVHLASDRAQQPFVAVNCSALPENLLEAELFGHVKGAFTGAYQSRTGRFEQANRGTIFLDEIAEMPLDLQAKLLRVLQEREFQRLGSSETVKIDVRVIAACNADLETRIREGRFREDLYYRINVVPLELPPLRSRAGDIPLLAQHFLAKVCAQEQLPLKRLATEALDRLEGYQWPGNVRQLENAIEMAVALSGDRSVLVPRDFPLPSQVGSRQEELTHRTMAIDLPDGGLDFEATMGRIELAILGQALERSRGNKTLAADLLRLKRTTLTAKLKSLEEQSRNWA